MIYVCLACVCYLASMTQYTQTPVISVLARHLREERANNFCGKVGRRPERVAERVERALKIRQEHTPATTQATHSRQPQERTNSFNAGWRLNYWRLQDANDVFS